jgi:hypothetical protein
MLAGLLLPSGARAFALDGCRLTLVSLDGAGHEIDRADEASDAGSQSRPLRVAWDGTVAWEGSADARTTRTTAWQVLVFGMPTPLRGGDRDHPGDTSGAGSIRVSDAAPFRISGLVHVSGRLEGEGGECSGSGWVMVLGDAASTVPFSVGVALVLLGLVLVAVGARGAWWAALAGGLLLGTGASMLLVTYALLPLGEATPGVAMAAGLLLGALAGVSGRRGQVRRA